MVTIIKAKGGNKTKNPASYDEFQAGKKIGRKTPAQVWVWEEPMAVIAGEQPTGHWEKLRGASTLKKMS